MTERGPRKSFIARAVIQPAMRAEFESAALELRRRTLSEEPDALHYELLRSADDPDTIVFVATFRDEDAFQVHLGLPFHIALDARIKNCLAKELELSFYEPLQ